LTRGARVARRGSAGGRSGGAARWDGWIPHYLPQAPCPKGTLALLTQVEDVLEVSVPLGDLPEETRAWERGVAELAEEDEDVAEYVRSLEESKDTADLPEATGEAIAREFERYLKRREDPDEFGGMG